MPHAGCREIRAFADGCGRQGPRFLRVHLRRKGRTLLRIGHTIATPSPQSFWQQCCCNCIKYQMLRFRK